MNLASENENSNLTEMNMDYHQLINHMKDLKRFLNQKHETNFVLGSIYQGNPSYSYFSITPEKLKAQKLKFVIILDHKTLSFSICLSGQNKKVRKKYWEFFKESDWRKYHLVESIDQSLSIIEHEFLNEVDFADKQKLNKRIEKESMKFMNDLLEVLT